MKLSEIVIGHEYITNVGTGSRRVRVLRAVEDVYSGRTKFEVQGVRDGKILPKYRSPAALRPAPVGIGRAIGALDYVMASVNGACGVCEQCTAGTGCELICKSA